MNVAVSLWNVGANMPARFKKKSRKELEWPSYRHGQYFAKARPTLVNKKNNKVASSNTWLLGLAAYALEHDDNIGITSLLPQARAQRLLLRNKVALKSVRIRQIDHVRRNAQQQAQKIIPCLAVRYAASLAASRRVYKTDFCKWIIKQLEDTESQIYKYASLNGYDDILESSKSVSWWRTQIKKLQS